MPFLIFRRNHLRSTSGIICGLGSFAVQFGDHFRSGDHLPSGIICGAVQIVCPEAKIGWKEKVCDQHGHYYQQDCSYHNPAL